MPGYCRVLLGRMNRGGTLRRKAPLRPAIISLLACACIATSACTDLSGVFVGGGTPPQYELPPTVVTRSHMESVAPTFSDDVKDVSQTCQSNEQVVGGGYRFDEAAVDLTQTTPHGGPFLVESQPTGNEWTVGFIARGGFKATIFAQCLSGGAGAVAVQSKSIDVPQAPVAQLWSVAVTCPVGTSPVGGGFSTQGGVAVVDLFPTGGGNFVNLSGHDVINGATAKALCYSRAATLNVVRDHRVVQIGPDLNDISLADFSPDCSAGAAMTTGGFEGELNAAAAPFINGPSTSGTGWEVELLSIHQQVNVSGVTGDVACVSVSA